MIRVGDRVTWTDGAGDRHAGVVMKVEDEMYVVSIDGVDDMSAVLMTYEMQLESAVDRLGKLANEGWVEQRHG